MTERQAEAAPTVLVVEDSEEMLDVVGRTLLTSGYLLETARDGNEGLDKALHLQPSLVVLDVALPRRNGFEVTKALRARSFGGRVLMLTALDSVADKVTGFDAGADDYLAKPFDIQELAARIKALLRRTRLAATDMALRAADLTLDPLTRHATRGGRTIVLTGREITVLALLMRHAGRTLTAEEISLHVWQQPLDPVRNNVAVYMRYLRKKIDDPALGPRLLRTVSGRGYMIKDML